MSDELLTRLQAMYTSREIRGYICVRLPNGRLESGWVERSLVSKGSDEEIPTSVNRQMLVMTDRAVRLFVNNIRLTEPGTFGMLMLGESGLKTGSLVMFLGDVDTTRVRYAITTWSDKTPPARTATIFFRHGLGLPNSDQSSEELTYDYVEQIREDVSAGVVTEALSIRFPQKKSELTNWIGRGIESAEASEEVPLRTGPMKNIPEFAPVVTRWILGLDLLKSLTTPVLMIIFGHPKSVNVCIWDSKSGLASFATLQSVDFQDCLLRYIRVLWTDLEDAEASPVTHSAGRSTHTDNIGSPPAVQPLSSHEASTSDMVEPVVPDPKSLDGMTRALEHLSRQIEETPVNDLLLRVSRLEQRIETIASRASSDSPPSGHDFRDDTSLVSLVSVRLKALVERLEELSQRLLSLEEQLRSVVKDERRED